MYFENAFGTDYRYHLEEQDIIDAARSQLASYQKPRSVRFVQSLPKAPTGKILKRDLRDALWSDTDRKV